MASGHPDDSLDALGRAEADELEAQAALAEAQAKAARARAERLRRQAEAGAGSTAGVPAPEIPTAAVPVRPSRRRSTVPWRPVVTAVSVVALGALITLSGIMAWQHKAAEQDRQRQAEYAAIARQGVVNLMSLDFTNADDNITRILDNATGKFKDDFSSESKNLAKALEESKVVTEVTVNGVAVESSADDSAVVLVAAKSQASSSKDARQAPQQFRIVVHLASDNGQFKISQVDFV